MSLPDEFVRPGLGLIPLDTSWAISSIIAEICQRAGIPPDRFDMAGLMGMCDGFSMTSDYAAYTGIENLGNIFLFDPSNFDGKLHFVPRGRPVVASITSDDLLDDDKPAQTLTRRDAIDVPRVLTLEYYDVAGGLQPDLQTSDRSLDARSKSTSESETTVMMRADDAARVVVVTHKVSIEEQRGEYEFSLPDSFIWLTTADCIMLDGQRVRITSIDIDDGFQTYKASFDRVSAYTSSVIGLPAGGQSTPPTLQVGETTMHFIDSPILRDSDDRLGFYIAVSGTSAAWKGATVEMSIDGGQSFTSSAQVTTRAVMGTLLTGLGAHSADVPDLHNFCTVELTRDVTNLIATDLRGMQNRANLALIDDEIINFGDAIESNPGVWNLGTFLRGRKGTEAKVHLAGARFVMLQPSRLTFVPADLFLLNRELVFRVTTFGSSNSGEWQTVNFIGRSQIERQPAFVKAVRVGSNIQITWQGVGRLGGGVSVAMGAFFSQYAVTVNGVTIVTPAQSYTVADPGGAVQISVAQINQITGNGPDFTVII